MTEPTIMADKLHVVDSVASNNNAHVNNDRSEFTMSIIFAIINVIHIDFCVLDVLKIALRKERKKDTSRKQNQDDCTNDDKCFFHYRNSARIGSMNFLSAMSYEWEIISAFFRSSSVASFFEAMLFANILSMSFGNSFILL